MPDEFMAAVPFLSLLGSVKYLMCHVGLGGPTVQHCTQIQDFTEVQHHPRRSRKLKFAKDYCEVSQSCSQLFTLAYGQQFPRSC